MTAPPKLETFATDPNWMSFAKALTAALQTPGIYGFDDTNQMLSAVAALRCVDAASLRNPLAAVNWMNQNAPEALEAENGDIAMTGVLLLSQISILDKGLASNLTPKFFDGELSRRQIHDALREAQIERGGRGVAAHERVKQVAAFEKAVTKFLTENLGSLELGENLQIVEGERSAIVPVDLVLLQNGEPIAVFEVKSHRQKRHQRYLIETLGVATLAAREYSNTILVTPESWGDSVDVMAKLIRDLDIRNVMLATFREQDGERSPEKFKYILGP